MSDLCCYHFDQLRCECIWLDLHLNRGHWLSRCFGSFAFCCFDHFSIPQERQQNFLILKICCLFAWSLSILNIFIFNVSFLFSMFHFRCFIFSFSMFHFLFSMFHFCYKPNFYFSDGIQRTIRSMIPVMIVPSFSQSLTYAILATLSGFIAQIGVLIPVFSKNAVLVLPGYNVHTCTPYSCASIRSARLKLATYDLLAKYAAVYGPGPEQRLSMPHSGFSLLFDNSYLSKINDTTASVL